jgi:hypothetical protein
MKKFYFVVLAIVFFSLNSYSQKANGIAKGVLQDSISATPLSDATISIVRTKDSSLISFTVTSSTGYFEIKNIEAGNYMLLVSYTGMQNL